MSEGAMGVSTQEDFAQIIHNGLTLGEEDIIYDYIGSWTVSIDWGSTSELEWLAMQVNLAN